MRVCVFLTVISVPGFLMAADPVLAKVQPVGKFEAPHEADEILNFTFSRDGKLLFASGNTALNKGFIRCWDVKSGKLLHYLSDLDTLTGPLAVTPDTKKLVYAALSGSGNIIVRSGEKWQAEEKYHLGSDSKIEGVTPLHEIVVANDGKRMLTAFGSGVHLWNLAGKPTHIALNVQEPDPPGVFATGPSVDAVAFSPDSNEIAVLDSCLGVEFFDTRGKVTGKLTCPDDLDFGVFRRVVYSPNGKLIATGFSPLEIPEEEPGDGKRRDRSPVTAILWDAKTRKEVRRFEGEKRFFEGIAFTADSRYLLQLAASRKKGEPQRIRLYDVASGKPMLEFETGIGKLAVFAVSNDDKHLVTGAGTNGLSLWSMEHMVKKFEKKDN